jgi:hypothetical protein
MKQVPPEGAPMMPQQPGDAGPPAPMPGQAAAPGVTAPMPMPAGAPMEAGAPGAAPVEEGAMEGGAMAETAEDDGSSSVLEALASQSDEADEAGGMESDDSMSLVLDKLDALTDIVGQLMDRMESDDVTQEGPAESQVTSDVPSMKSVDEEALKEIISDTIKSVFASMSIPEVPQKDLEISDESASMLAETIKSVMESMEEGLVGRVVERVLSETVVTKSVSSVDNSAPIVHPGAIADGVEESNVDTQVMKSVSGANTNELSSNQLGTLKSMVTEYNNIFGYTSDKSQQRARVIERAQKEIGIHPTIFNVYANKAQRGKF